jgi:hypothetical protein
MSGRCVGHSDATCVMGGPGLGGGHLGDARSGKKLPPEAEDVLMSVQTD